MVTEEAGMDCSGEVADGSREEVLALDWGPARLWRGQGLDGTQQDARSRVDERRHHHPARQDRRYLPAWCASERKPMNEHEPSEHAPIEYHDKPRP